MKIAAEPAESGETILAFAPPVSADSDKMIKTIARSIERHGANRGWAERVVYRVKLVLSELTSNVASHGWPQGGPAPCIEFRIACEGDAVRIDMTDNGAAFDPLTEAPPVPVHERGRPVTLGGLGVHLVKAMTRTMVYRRDGTHNRLRLTIGAE